MAGKVNTRFVVLLGIGLALVCGLMALAVVTFVFKSGADHVRNGDAAMANGEYVAAKMLYGKAVSDDPTRVDWLEKWLGAIESTTPDTETAYRDSFQTDLIPALAQIAQVQQTNIAAHDRYLAMQLRQLDAGFVRVRADRLAQDVTNAASFFDRDPSSDPAWKRLLRYRGIARGMVLIGGGVMDEDEVALIGDDLRAALEADPGDSRSMVMLLQWMLSTGTSDLLDDQVAEAQAVRASVIEAADGYLEARPGDAAVLAQRALTMLDFERTAAMQGVDEMEQATRAFEAMSLLAPEFDRVLAAVRAEGVDGLDVRTLQRLQALERFILPESRMSQTRELVIGFMRERPDDLDIRWFAASLDREIGDLESASERFASMTDLEIPPVSLEGLRRFARMRDAQFSQALVELRILLGEDGEGSSDRLEKVVGIRDRLSESLSEDDARLTLLDARIAEAGGKRNEALRLYRRFNEQTGSQNLESLRFEANMAAQLGQLGTARDALERVIALRSTDVSSLVALGDILASLNEMREAGEMYRRALAVNPGNRFAEEGLRRIEGIENPDSIDDPGLSLLLRSRRIATGSVGQPADPAGAAQLLVDGLESVDYDPRVAGELMRIRVDSGDIAGARAIGEESLRRHPENDLLPGLLTALEGESTIEVLERIIMDSDESELVKTQRLATLYFTRGENDKIDAVLGRLEELAPDDAQTIELGFVRAVNAGSFERARSLAERATAQNLDFVGGLSYQARLADAEAQSAAGESRRAFAEGRAREGDELSSRARALREEAVSLLEQAAALGSGDAAIYRLLGMAQRQVGRVDSAVAAFEEALSIRPDEVQTTLEYVSTLAEAGRLVEALDVARRQQRFSLSDPKFVRLWLSLEAAAGGDEGRVLAIGQREKMLESNPLDIENRYALAGLYIQEENWGDSKTLIDGLLADDPSLRSTETLALWYANQGRVGTQDGLLLANQAYQRYVRGLGDGVTSEPFISLARFMVGRGRQDLAISAADQAIALEDPSTLEGTKMKGELLMAIGQSASAAAEFKKIVDAGADETGGYRARLIEMYLRTDQYGLAQEVMATLPDSVTGTLTNLLQRSEIAKGLGDPGGERRILDEAVSKFPDEPLVYIKRAQSMLGDPTLLPDVLSDLEAALRRNPNDWRALRVRAAAYFDADRRTEAIRDLRAVLRANPSLDDALFAVMNELLNDNRLSDAMDAAREVLDARPTDAPLMFQLGKLFESRGDWRESAEMFERAWQTRRSPADGAGFIDAALRVNPPDVAAANAVINDLAAMVPGGIDESPGLLAAQALVLRARGREDFAVQQMTKAFDLSRGNDFQIQTWAQNAARFYVDLDADNEMNYYRSLRARFSDAESRAWVDAFMAQRQLARSMEVDEALSVLTRLSEDGSAPEPVRVIAFRALGNHAFEQDDFEGAVAAWKAGLEKVPDNWELNNNAAYVLAMELGRHDEALVLAERAIATGPARSEPYDTLAEVYIKLGRYDEAEQMIEAGEQRAREYTARVSLTITRARMALARGDNEEASRLLRRARALLRTVAGRDARLEGEIDRVESGIGSDG